LFFQEVLRYQKSRVIALRSFDPYIKRGIVSLMN